jgi:hypothetical protein
MTMNRVLTLAAILVAATALLYLAGPHRQLRQTRVFVAEIRNQPEAELAQATKYLREACRDIILIKDQRRAEYRLRALWGGDRWVVFVEQKDLNLIFHGEGPDAMETFRQGCTAIRDDAKELADFDAHTAPMPIGRYSLNSANPDHVFLLDTKTGAVWELKPRPLGDTQEFERISVEGLYDSKAW